MQTIELTAFLKDSMEMPLSECFVLLCALRVGVCALLSTYLWKETCCGVEKHLKTPSQSSLMRIVLVLLGCHHLLGKVEARRVRADHKNQPRKLRVRPRPPVPGRCQTYTISGLCPYMRTSVWHSTDPQFKHRSRVRNLGQSQVPEPEPAQLTKASIQRSLLCRCM
jgi:hypothetical protein